MSEMTPEPPEIKFTQWLENLRADVAESVAGVTLRGARYVPVGANAGATVRPAGSSCALVGWSLRNLSLVNRVNVTIRDGSSTDAEVVMVLSLAPGESSRDWFGPGGVSLLYGCFVQILDDLGAAGSVDGSVFLRSVE